MQFKFFDSATDPRKSELNSSFFRRTLHLCRRKSEIEIHLQFLKQIDMRWVSNGNLFFVKVAEPINFASKCPKPLLCNTYFGTGWLENSQIVFDRFPKSWTRYYCVTRSINFVNSPIKSVSLSFKSDIPVEEYGPKIHGCRLLNQTATDYLYVIYDATRKEFSLNALPPVVVASLKTMCLQAMTTATLQSNQEEEKKYPDYSRLPLELQEPLQRLLSPIRQMSSPRAFKTVKVWHVNKKLYQEIEYDANTKKYHGKARMWDFFGELILVLYFKQGLMHGECKTMYPHTLYDEITSRTMFHMNKPINQRIQIATRKTLCEKTYFEPGSCTHRIRVHIKLKNYGNVMATFWGLLVQQHNDGDWEMHSYKTELLRNQWDSDSYHRKKENFKSHQTYLPPCFCGVAFTTKINKSLRLIELEKKTKRKCVTIIELKPRKHEKNGQRKKKQKK